MAHDGGLVRVDRLPPEASDPVFVGKMHRVFGAQYAPWIQEQNAHHDRNGLWCEGLLAWPREME